MKHDSNSPGRLGVSPPDRPPSRIMFGPSTLGESFQSIAHKRMRQRNVRHGFDFFHIENAQIGLPLMEPIQRIMIGAEILRQCLRGNGSVEHPAQGNAIHDIGVNRKLTIRLVN
jgi:hypothetical protein